MFWRIFLTSVLSVFYLGAEPILIGIAGGTGSGKTTLADEIKKAYPMDSILISQDSYYKDLSSLPFEERARTNFDHPESLDFALLFEQLIDLKKGQKIEQPRYSFHTHTREPGTTSIEAAPLIIVEGILLFSIPEIRDLFDIKIYVDTDDDIRVLRRIERDIRERSRDFYGIKDQYLSTVKPMHDLFVQPSKQFADIIVPNGGRNPVALQMILCKIKNDLSQRAVQ